MRYIYLTLFLLLATAGFAQIPVIPDSTFNGTGRNVFSTGGTLSFGDNIALQADGKIIMTGANMSLGGIAELGVARLNTDGTFDNTFGISGISLISLGGLSYQGGFEPEILIQPDGKILICGFSQESGEDDMLICRLLTTGALDPSFGTGGTTTINFATAGQPDVANAIALDASGNIYACGSCRTGGTPFTNDIAIAKLTPAGALDPTFSGDGKLLIDLTANQWDYAYGIAVRTDGKIVVTGYTGIPADVFAIRLLPDGSFDPTFSGDGKVTVDLGGQNVADEAWGMAMKSDGKIIIVGDGYNTTSSTFPAYVVQLTEDGSPDPTFSSDGIASINISGNTDVMRNIIIQPDGKYLVSGDAMTSATRDFAAIRLHPDGTLDTDFNMTGIFTMDVTELSKDDIGYGLALQPDGKILLSGNTVFSEFGNQKYSVVRLIESGMMASFTASSVFNCSGSTVQFNNYSYGENLSYAWTFEGGTPATSTLMNPSVVYATPGIFDVKLVVYNSTESDTTLKTDYIEVISAPSAPSTPVGVTSLCNSEITQYTTAAVAEATSYNWQVVPSAAGVISGSGTTITFTASQIYSGAYSIKVNASNQCGTSSWSEELSCTLFALPQMFMLQGDGAYCEGTTGANLTLSGSTVGLSYELYLDAGATGSIQAGTGATLEWNNITTAGFYTVLATGAECSATMGGQIYVSSITAPAQPAMPSGDNSLCSGATSAYSVPNVAATDLYIWALTPPEAGTLTSTANQASVNWSPSFTGSATLAVSASNFCGSSPQSAALIVTVNPLPVPVVTGLNTVCQNWETDYVTTQNAGSSYAWSVSGGNIVSGAGTSGIRVKWNSAGAGSVTVTETSVQDCEGSSAAFSVAVDPCVGINEPQVAAEMRVYPNPAENFLTIIFSEAAGTNYQLRFADNTGRVVMTLPVNSGAVRMDGIEIGQLKSGVYSIQLLNNGVLVSQQKIIKL